MFSTLSGLWVIFKSIIVKYSLQWRSKTILDSNSDSQARSSLLQCTSFHWSSAFHKLKHSVRQVFWISLHLNILGITTVKLCYIKSSNSPHMYSHIPENFPLGSLDVNLIVFSSFYGKICIDWSKDPRYWSSEACSVTLLRLRSEDIVKGVPDQLLQRPAMVIRVYTLNSSWPTDKHN